MPEGKKQYGERVQLEYLRWYFDNLHLSQRQRCDRNGVLNGCPYEIKRGTVQDWLKHYKLYGEVPAVTRKKAGKRKSGKRSLTPTEEKMLHDLALREPELYLDELQDEMRRIGLPKIHTSTISKYLRRSGLSLRFLKRKAKERCEVEMANFLERIKYLDPETFIFVDETAKDEKACRRRRGWCKKGSDASIIRRFIRKDERFTLIAAMNLDGFIHEACYQIDRQVETVDMDTFSFYLDNILLPVMGNFLQGERNSVLIIDNAPVHDQNYIQERVESVGAIVIFTARYCPHINPIEYGFRIYKAGMRRYKRFTTSETQLYYTAMAQVTRPKLINIFNHCFKGTFYIPSEEDEIESSKRKIWLDIAIGIGRGIARALELS